MCVVARRGASWRLAGAPLLWSVSSSDWHVTRVCALTLCERLILYLDLALRLGPLLRDRIVVMLQDACALHGDCDCDWAEWRALTTGRLGDDGRRRRHSEGGKREHTLKMVSACSLSSRRSCSRVIASVGVRSLLQARVPVRRTVAVVASAGCTSEAAKPREARVQTLREEQTEGHGAAPHSRTEKDNGEKRA